MSGPLSPAQRRARARAYHVAVLAAAVVILIAALVLQVRGSSSIALLGWQVPELCWWKRTLGLDCPGCGLTRAIVSAAQGNWAASWQFHPAGLLLLPVLIAQVPYRGWQLWRIASQRDPIQSTLLTVIGLGVLAIPLLAYAGRLVSTLVLG